MREFKEIEVNTIYLLTGLLFLAFGMFVELNNFALEVIFTEYGIILLPPLIYAFTVKMDIVKVFRIKLVKLKYFIITFVIMMFAMPFTLFLNLAMTTILSFFDKAYVMDIPMPTNSKELVVSIFLISISAGICEEVFFRGMIQSSYEKSYGRTKGIIFTALLFGIFHFNFQNLLGPIFLGLIIGHLVSYTGSIFLGMFAHIVNNGLAVLISYGASNIDTTTAGIDAAEMINDSNMMLLGTISWGVIGIFSLGIAIFLISLVKKMADKEDKLKIESTLVSDQEDSITDDIIDLNVEATTVAYKSSGFLTKLPVVIMMILYIIFFGLYFAFGS